MKVTIAQLRDRGEKPFELHWIAGLTCNERDFWYARPVFRQVGTSSMRFEMYSQPIGILPVLAPGRVFGGDEMFSLHPEYEQATVTISDLSAYEEITSADIPDELYSFGGRDCGVQRLFRYRTDHGEILIPTIELIRYLFLHNRSLANALMRPGALNLLFRPELPGYRNEMEIHFTSGMPLRCLSREFVREFAWLALDPDARRSWDSVQLQSRGRPYVTFTPPVLKNSTWTFRGVQHGNRWLVLELLRLTGKCPPCKKLRYGHPSLKRILRNAEEDPNEAGDLSDDADDQSGTHIADGIEVDDGQGGAKSNHDLKVINLPSKQSEFAHEVEVSKIVMEVSGGPRAKSKRRRIGNGVEPAREIITSSAGELSNIAKLPPIEFRLLVPANWDSMGDLAALSNAVHRMAIRLPSIQFAMSMCHLKEGRSFSTVNRNPRLALMVVITQELLPPIVLLDVQRAGEVALSLMALRFKQVQTAELIEGSAKKMLDGLVEANGHWNRETEAMLSDECACERFPKALSPRDKADSYGYAPRWATRLARRLGLGAKPTQVS